MKVVIYIKIIDEKSGGMKEKGEEMKVENYDSRFSLVKISIGNNSMIVRGVELQRAIEACLDANLG